MQTAHIDVEVPARVLSESGVNQEFIQQGVVAMLYEKGLLGPKTACELIDVSRREFEEIILPQFGYTALGEAPEDIDAELNPPQ